MSMKFAAAIKTSDHGLVGTALADWCQGNPSSAAQMIERLRDQNSARLKIINDKMARIHDLETAKISIDMDTHFDGHGMRVFGRVVDWQPEDYEAGGAGKGIGVRLLCEYESDNFGMRKAKPRGPTCPKCFRTDKEYQDGREWKHGGMCGDPWHTEKRRALALSNGDRA